MQAEFTKLENLTLSILRNVDPHNGSIHDYRNALIPLMQAEKAISAAYRAMHKARQELEFTARQQ
jgi:hypothetical protein